MKQLFAMLLADNLDLVAVDSRVGHYVNRREQWADDIWQARRPIDEKDAFFALSKKSEAVHLLQEFNDAITAVKADAEWRGWRAVQATESSKGR